VIRLIDGHDLKVIDKQSAAPPDNSNMVRLEGPSRLLDAALLPASGDAARNQALKAAVTDLIEHSLESTLQDLRLVGRS
jgi:hypothetical protein